VGETARGVQHAPRHDPHPDGGDARDFLLTATTNFRDVDFPLDSLAPTAIRQTDGGWDLSWRYGKLISGLHRSAWPCPRSSNPDRSPDRSATSRLYRSAFFTGITVTIGCILTLFAAMQLTAQIRWSERFR
jgi:hypothetical protein